MYLRQMRAIERIRKQIEENKKTWFPIMVDKGR